MQQHMWSVVAQIYQILWQKLQSTEFNSRKQAWIFSICILKYWEWSWPSKPPCPSESYHVDSNR